MPGKQFVVMAGNSNFLRKYPWGKLPEPLMSFHNVIMDSQQHQPRPQLTVNSPKKGSSEHVKSDCDTTNLNEWSLLYSSCLLNAVSIGDLEWTTELHSCLSDSPLSLSADSAHQRWSVERFYFSAARPDWTRHRHRRSQLCRGDKSKWALTDDDKH